RGAGDLQPHLPDRADADRRLHLVPGAGHGAHRGAAPPGAPLRPRPRAPDRRTAPGRCEPRGGGPVTGNALTAAAGKAAAATGTARAAAAGKAAAATGTAPVLRLDEVGQEFGGHAALDGVCLEVAEGEVVVVVGPSGSGKSTLVRCVHQLEDIDAGAIYLDG